MKNMKSYKSILKIKLNLNTKKDLLKLALDQKEIIQYNAWKSLEENSKSREAMDKVVARLKLEDDTWLEQEEELVLLKNKVSVVNNITELLQGYINQGIDTDVVEDIAEEYISDFNLGEYL